ncbi:MAG TPA: aspartyl protease family protein [Candidatus Cybelea sp.]|nr:aspartyl protease family protein [Candidatus Cybelea sp.]
MAARLEKELALIAIASLMPLAATAQTIVPFTLTGGLVTVKATANGLPLTTIVDLGAGVDVLSSKAARTLGVAATRRYTNWRMEGERVDGDIGTLPTLSLGTLRVSGAPAIIWNGLDGSGIDGLISATAFRNQPVTFDYSSQQLILEDEASFARRTRSAAKVPIELGDDRDISLGIFAWFDFGGGQRGLCEIDTGSQGFFLDKRFAPKLGVNLDDPRLKRVKGPAGERIVGDIPRIALVGVPSSAIAAPKAVFTNLIYDCNVGNEFWRGRAFTLDISNRALYVGGSS